jgi:hypothetical protein
MRAHLRFLLAVLALGLGLGTALGFSTSPLAAETAIAVDVPAEDGFGHIDDMGTYKFCHCGPEKDCYPCANWPPKTTDGADAGAQ